MSMFSLEFPGIPEMPDDFDDFHCFDHFDLFRTLKNFFAKIYEFKKKKKQIQDLEDLENRAGYILDTYGNSILRLAYSYVHNMSDAEDLLQDALIAFLDSAPAFKSPDHEKAWLLKVTANLSKNRIAYNKLRSTDELDESLIDEGREDLSFVWEAVKNLPDKYREAIHLFYYEGYSTAEIAAILGRKESTIRSDLRRGRMELKMILKEVYDFG